MGKLTAKKVEALTKPGRYSDEDGTGFHVRVDGAGRKYYILRIHVGGKRKDVAIGSAARMTLSAAREKARRQREQIEACGTTAVEVPTFAQAAALAHKARKVPETGPLSLYELLASVRPEGLSEHAWTSLAKVSRSWFHDIRKGAMPRTNTLEKVLGPIGMSLAQFYDLDRSAGRMPAPTPGQLHERAALPVRGAREPMDIPLLGTAQASDMEIGDDGKITFIERMDLNSLEVIDYLRRPPSLAGRQDVYAITVIGNSMLDRFEDGDPAYVDSKRQASPGDYVVVQLRRVQDGEERLHIALLKQLVCRTSNYVELRQKHPEAVFTIPLSEVASVHRVIPWREVIFF